MPTDGILDNMNRRGSASRRHRYGHLLLTTPEGRFYYDNILGMVSFVPKGRQTASEDDGPAYTREQALKMALKAMGIRLHT